MTVQHLPTRQSRDEANAGLMWFTEQCMANGAPLESYIAHAERIGDRELAAFFRRALAATDHVRPGDRRRGRPDRRR